METPSILIDMKKKRIRIHKNSLKYLKNPKYVYLLINPNKKYIAIQRCDKKKRDAIKVSYSSDKDCEIYSYGLLEQMAQLEHSLNEQTTFKLYGHPYNNEIIEFNIIYPITVPKG